MYISFVTNRRLSKRLQTKLEKEFGFEITLDCEHDFQYFFGYSQENLGEGGWREEDPLPYDEAVRCCGILWREGIHHFGIEGDGGWATGMIMRTDFTGFAMTDADKHERARVSAIFWRAADPSKLREINPPIAA